MFFIFIQQPNFQSYQPKSYSRIAESRESSVPENFQTFNDQDENNRFNANKRATGNGVSGIKIIGGNEHDSQRFDEQRSPVSPGKSQFDLSKSMDKHYSNFSVNDIVRQNFLPTTRVSHDSVEQDNEIKTIIQNRNNPNHREEETRKTSLTRLSSLNIQNQYQYQKSSRPLSPVTNDNDTVDIRKNSIQQQSLSIGSESYGKPIISPRMSYEIPSLPLPPQSLLDSTSESVEPVRQSKYKPKISKKFDQRKTTSTQNENGIYSLERLKKTQHGSALLARENTRDDREELPIQIEPNEYSASNLFGTMSLSIERLDEIDNDRVDSPSVIGNALLPKEAESMNRSSRTLSSQFEENVSQVDRNPIQDFHDRKSSVSAIREKINGTLETKDHQLKKQQEANPSPATEKKSMQKWIQQTDFRPKITNPKFKNVQSPREKASSNQLRSRIDVFSSQPDPSTPYEKFIKVSSLLCPCVDYYVA